MTQVNDLKQKHQKDQKLIT